MPATQANKVLPVGVGAVTIRSVIIRCENLDQAYGDRSVLHGVSFGVSAPCTGLLGPNGAGKSTLLKCLLGQRPVRPGRLMVAGHDPAVEPLRVRQRVGSMPENDVYLPGMNALELVSFCAELSGLKRSDAVARAHEVLDYVDLGEVRYRDVDGYSTGMRQRMRFAQALVHGPELILLDEPTTGLDPTGRVEMLALVNDIAHRRGLAVLFSSHILQDIERTCDDVIVLNEGRVLFSGSRELFQRQEARTLHVRVKQDSGRLVAILGLAGCSVTESPGSEYMVIELPEGQGPELIWRAAWKEGVQIRHLAPATLSLDQAFERFVTSAQEAAGGDAQ